MDRLSILLGVALLLLASVNTPLAGAPHDPLPGGAETGSLEPAAGRFLVASRSLRDPNFSKTVVYLLQHDATGSLGLVINRPLEVTLGEALTETELANLGSYSLNYGGPVSRRHIIMLLRGLDAPENAVPVIDGVYASNNMDLLYRLDAAKKPASELRLFAGHAGWSSGQLQRELDRDDWFVIPGDIGPVFAAEGATLWKRLIEKLDPAGIYVRQEAAMPAGL